MAGAARPATGQSGGAASSDERRRQKLLNIQKREEMKDVLTTKFRDRYSGAGKQTDEVSVSASAIGREVDRFCGTASMTQANLQRLERRIGGQAQGRSPTECEMLSDYTISSYSACTTSGSRSARGQGPLTRMQARSQQTPRGSARSMGDEAYAKDWMTGHLDWSTLDKFAGLMHNRDEKKQRACQLDVKDKLKKDLDQQVKDVQYVKEKEKLRENALVQEQQNKIKIYDEQEQQKMKIAREKALKVKSDRDEQLQVVLAAKSQERRQEKEEGEALMFQIASELDLEKQRLELKKMQEMQIVSKHREENEAQIKEQKMMQKREKEHDKKLMSDYAKKLEDDDEKKAAELRRRLEKQEQVMKRMGDGIAEGVRQKLAEEEKLIEQQRVLKDEAAARIQSEKAEKNRQQRIETQREVVKQLQEKEQLRVVENSHKKQTAELLENDKLDYLASEKDKESRRRQQHLEHRLELERQIQSRVPGKKHCLSEVEVRMNKDLLHLVSQTIQEGAAEDA